MVCLYVCIYVSVPSVCTYKFPVQRAFLFLNIFIESYFLVVNRIQIPEQGKVS